MIVRNNNKAKVSNYFYLGERKEHDSEQGNYS